MRTRAYRFAGFLVSISALCGAMAQEVAGGPDDRPRTPTLKQIMADPEWIARSPDNIAWSWDGKSVLFDRQREGSRLSDRWIVRAEEGAEPERISDADLPFASAAGGAFNAGRTKKAFERGGDVFVRDMQTGELDQITRTTARESSPIWMTDGSIAFRRDGVWIVREAGTGGERQAADIRTEDDPAATKAKEEAKDTDYLTEQQRRLFAIVRDRRARDDERDAQRDERRDADATRVPGPFYLGEGWRVHARALSPGGRWLALTVSKDPGDDKNDAMPAYVNEDGYVSTSSVRVKVGLAKKRADRIVLVDLEAERVHWMDASELPTITEDPLAWLKDERASDDEDSDGDADDENPIEDESGLERDETDADIAAEKEAEEEEEEDSKPRSFAVEQVKWSPDGTGVLFVLHSHDNKDRWIATADLESLAEMDSLTEIEQAEGDEAEEDADKPMLSAIHHLRDEAWINWRYNEADWLADSSGVWYLSEETGYSHLYFWERSSGHAFPLTEGRFTVQDVVEWPAEDKFLFRCNFMEAGVYEIGYASRYYEDGRSVPAEYGPATELNGSVDSFVLSADQTRLAFLHSTAMDPPEIFVAGTDGNFRGGQLTRSQSDLYRSFDWVRPRFVEVPSSHGEHPIHCRLYDDPSVAAPGPNGKPIVVFSHGAGYTQHVYNGWSYYFREHMFHTLLCRAGYIVIAPDFRASAGYGRDWRTAIYRNMGRPELEDFDDCLAWLGTEYNPANDPPSKTISRSRIFRRPIEYCADLDNVGIYGGSYGGFMTLMAMFLRPDVYDCGAALRSVTDWAHYNDPYTSNILNTPDIDPEAYERSSPIEHAEGLKGALLMCHGMLDDNVVAQDTIRLAQRLIELEKENWEMALYPVEPHGFLEPTGWLDEYRRIFKLFETHLKD